MSPTSNFVCGVGRDLDGELLAVTQDADLGLAPRARADAR